MLKAERQGACAEHSMKWRFAKLARFQFFFARFNVVPLATLIVRSRKSHLS